MTAPLRRHGRPVIEWFRMCLAKRRWPDEYVARAVAGYALSRHRNPGVTRLYVYRCPGCRGWHLTKSGRLNRFSHPVTATDLYAPIPATEFAVSIFDPHQPAPPASTGDWNDVWTRADTQRERRSDVAAVSP